MAEPSEQPRAPTSTSIAALALPALGVLAAEPLYLLFDIAVVGRLGALALAGLAIGGLILGWVSALLWVVGIAVIFLFLGGLAWLATLN